MIIMNFQVWYKLKQTSSLSTLLFEILILSATITVNVFIKTYTCPFDLGAEIYIAFRGFQVFTVVATLIERFESGSTILILDIGVWNLLREVIKWVKMDKRS